MALLDQIFGPEWPLLINVRAFSISDGNACVLGQIGIHGAGLRRSDWTSPYNIMLDEFEGLNGAVGAVQDFLFERFVWPKWKKEGKRELINVGCGFSGGTPNDLWVKAIRKRQEELGGEPAIKAAREKWVRKRG